MEAWQTHAAISTKHSRFEFEVAGGGIKIQKKMAQSVSPHLKSSSALTSTVLPSTKPMGSPAYGSEMLKTKVSPLLSLVSSSGKRSSLTYRDVVGDGGGKFALAACRKVAEQGEA
jgi:hypothetical protein